MTTFTKSASGLVTSAKSSDGRIFHSSMTGSERTIIDGRDVWRKEYLDPKTGMVTGEIVSDADWAAAVAIMHAVADAQAQWAADARATSDRRMDARGLMSDAELSQKVRGFADGAN